MPLDVTIDQIKMSAQADDASEEGKGEKRSSHGVSDLTPGGYHTATLMGADLAYERPLLITIGADCTARVWNYHTMKCEVVHDFGADEPIAVAFHSSGFQVRVDEWTSG
ncbi:hypothetical protein B484DRAFT_26768 [Ochromonadaceae sp. CCMP2298]|nr:hypothetical protein B484DRAFT_26768 [Ochromonadaceae sp. CCMP2298]